MGDVQLKPTPDVKGRFAREIIDEVKKKPSLKAIQRNEQAYKLLKKLRNND